MLQVLVSLDKFDVAERVNAKKTRCSQSQECWLVDKRKRKQNVCKQSKMETVHASCSRETETKKVPAILLDDRRGGSAYEEQIWRKCPASFLCDCLQCRTYAHPHTQQHTHKCSALLVGRQLSDAKLRRQCLPGLRQTVYKGGLNSNQRGVTD
jgi:hypothetical protein